jgi:hypothetical protein
MKASDLIAQLQMSIDKFGDMEVIASPDHYRTHVSRESTALEPGSLLELVPITPKGFWRLTPKPGVSCFVITPYREGY